MTDAQIAVSCSASNELAVSSLTLTGMIGSGTECLKAVGARIRYVASSSFKNAATAKSPLSSPIAMSIVAGMMSNSSLSVADDLESRGTFWRGVAFNFPGSIGKRAASNSREVLCDY